MDRGASYDGMPVILFVTTSPNAEDRVAAQAHRAWFCRGTEALQVLLITTERISRHPEGVLVRSGAGPRKQAETWSGVPTG